MFLIHVHRGFPITQCYWRYSWTYFLTLMFGLFSFKEVGRLKKKTYWPLWLVISKEVHGFKKILPKCYSIHILCCYTASSFILKLFLKPFHDNTYKQICIYNFFNCCVIFSCCINTAHLIYQLSCSFALELFQVFHSNKKDWNKHSDIFLFEIMSESCYRIYLQNIIFNVLKSK